MALDLKQFENEIGVTESTTMNASREDKSKEVNHFLNSIVITLRALEEETLWANRTELYTGLLKEDAEKDRNELDLLLEFWCCCIEGRSRVNNTIAKNLFQLHSSNPCVVLTGNEVDISSVH